MVWFWFADFAQRFALFFVPVALPPKQLSGERDLEDKKVQSKSTLEDPMDEIEVIRCNFEAPLIHHYMMI